jgi:hypothetical protein
VGGFASNVVDSTVNLVRNTLSAAIHPKRTAEGVGYLVAGISKQLLRKAGLDLPTNESDTAAENFEKYYQNRYGGVDNFLNSLYTDPVGVLADASVVLGTGGGALSKLGTILKGSQEAAEAARIAELGEEGAAAAKAAEGSWAFNPKTAQFEQVPGAGPSAFNPRTAQFEPIPGGAPAAAGSPGVFTKFRTAVGTGLEKVGQGTQALGSALNPANIVSKAVTVPLVTAGKVPGMVSGAIGGVSGAVLGELTGHLMGMGLGALVGTVPMFLRSPAARQFLTRLGSNEGVAGIAKDMVPYLQAAAKTQQQARQNLAASGKITLPAQPGQSALFGQTPGKIMLSPTPGQSSALFGQARGGVIHDRNPEVDRILRERLVRLRIHDLLGTRRLKERAR